MRHIVIQVRESVSAYLSLHKRACEKLDRLFDFVRITWVGCFENVSHKASHPSCLFVLGLLIAKNDRTRIASEFEDGF